MRILSLNWSSLFVLVLVVAWVTGGVARASDSEDLVEAAMVVSGDVYGSETSYERVLLPASVLDELSNPGAAMSHASVVAAFGVTCLEERDPPQIELLDAVTGNGPDFTNALRVAEAFIPLPRLCSPDFCAASQATYPQLVVKRRSLFLLRRPASASRRLSTSIALRHGFSGIA